MKINKINIPILDYKSHPNKIYNNIISIKSNSIIHQIFNTNKKYRIINFIIFGIYIYKYN